MKEMCPDVGGNDPSPYHDHTHWENGKLVEDEPTPFDNVYATPEDVGRMLEIDRINALPDITRRIMHQIVKESIYKQDMTWLMWHACHELEETNGLPDGVTAEDIFQCYLRVFHHED